MVIKCSCIGPANIYFMAMRKYSLILIALCACAPADQNPFHQACAADGLKSGSPEWQRCVIERTEREEKIQAAQHNAIINAEHQACTDYGFKKNSNSFANCMFSIERERQLEAQQRQQFAIQQQVIAEQNSQALLGYSLGLMQMNQPMQNRGNSFNCTSVKQGIFTNTNCN